MRRVILLFATMGVAILLSGTVGLLTGLGPGGAPRAEAQPSKDAERKQTASQQQATVEKKSGIFNLRYGDPKLGSDGKPQGSPRVQYILTDDEGQETELLLGEQTARPLGGPLALTGKGVKVEGTRAPGGTLKVETIRRHEQADAASAVEADALTGSRPNATIMCRFGDSTNVSPRDQNYFYGLVGGEVVIGSDDAKGSHGAPSMDHYWRETSYNNVNLSGSWVFGWYNLPQPRSHYITSTGANLNALAQDCTAAADANVHFPSYTNINLMFNQNLDCCAWGGSMTLTRDGQTKTYGTTWMPPWAYNNQYVLAHELGHSFGLPHSSGPYSATYDSKWDPMSSGGTCSPPHSTYGCLADHTISYHKDKLNWIPSAQKVTVASGSFRTVTIDRLGTSSGTLMARIPIGTSTTQYYTVEARRLVGYDSLGPIPGEAIVIHKVNTTLGDRHAQVMDATNDNNPNDAGAMWVPGETFKDSTNKISIKVIGQTTNGYTVDIINKVLPKTYQETDRARTSYAGWNWNWKDSNFSGGYDAFNSSKGASTSIRFTGTYVNWQTTTGTDGGRTHVYLDGVFQKTFDAYAATRKYNVVGYSKSGLKNTAHTLKLVNSGTKNPSSSGTFTDLDAFRVGKPGFLGTTTFTTYQEIHPYVTYGNWNGASSSSASGGTYRYSNSTVTPAARFSTFRGPYTYARMWTGPGLGSAKAIVTDASSGAVVKTQLLPLGASTSAWRWKLISGLDAHKVYNLEIASAAGTTARIDAYYAVSNISSASAAASPSDERPTPKDSRGGDTGR